MLRFSGYMVDLLTSAPGLILLLQGLLERHKVRLTHTIDMQLQQLLSKNPYLIVCIQVYQPLEHWILYRAQAAHSLTSLRPVHFQRWAVTIKPIVGNNQQDHCYNNLIKLLAVDQTNFAMVKPVLEQEANMILVILTHLPALVIIVWTAR